MNVQKRIKVLYIQVPPGGGSLIALHELLKHLPEYIDPVVLCYYQNKYSALLESVSRVIYLNAEKYVREEQENFSRFKFISSVQWQYKLLKDYFLRSKSIIKDLIKIITKEQPHIVHHNNEIFLNRDAIRATAKLRVMQVVHERSLGKYGISYMYHIADKLLMKKVAARIDITKAVATHFDKLYPGIKQKKIVLHDCVDTQKYFPSKGSEELKKSLGIGQHDIVITSIGRIIKWKGQHILIEAVNLLKDKLKNFKVLLVGPHDEGIGSSTYKEELKQLLITYNLEDHILFTGNRDDVPALINLSDVVVHSSIKPEPQGLVVIETLLCNKPLIASGNGGSGELVEKYGGVALEKVDAATLSAKLETILIKNEKPLINHTALQNDFNASKQVSVLMQLYYDLLAKNAE